MLATSAEQPLLLLKFPMTSQDQLVPSSPSSFSAAPFCLHTAAILRMSTSKHLDEVPQDLWSLETLMHDRLEMTYVNTYNILLMFTMVKFNLFIAIILHWYIGNTCLIYRIIPRMHITCVHEPAQICGWSWSDHQPPTRYPNSTPTGEDPTGCSKVPQNTYHHQHPENHMKKIDLSMGSRGGEPPGSRTWSYQVALKKQIRSWHGSPSTNSLKLLYEITMF